VENPSNRDPGGAGRVGRPGLRCCDALVRQIRQSNGPWLRQSGMLARFRSVIHK